MITKIEIKKFRQLENVVEDKIGKINELYGKNGCGKTSFINFISWIVTGTTLDFGVSDDENLDETNPSAFIGGKITVVNEQNKITYEFERNYGYDENDKKVNLFFVNGKQFKKQDEYYETIKQAFNMNYNIGKINRFDILKALTDVYYVGDKDNEVGFRTLISQLLNINTDNILFTEREGKYDVIKEDYILNSCDYDNTKDYYNQKIGDYKNGIEYNDKMIKLGLENGYDKEKLINLVNERKEYRDKTQKELDYNTSDELTALNTELDKLNIEYQNSIIDDKLKVNKTDEEIKLDKLKEEYNSKVDVYESETKRQAKILNELSPLKDKLNSIKNDIEKIKNSKFEEIVCPNCKTIINEEEANTFNKNKAQKLKALNEEKKKCDEEISKIDTKFEINLLELNSELETLLVKVNEQKTLVKKVLSDRVDNYTSDTTKSLLESIKAKNEERTKIINELNAERDKKLQEYKNKMNEYDDKINAMDSLRQSYENALVLKENLKNDKKILGNYQLKKSLLEEFKKDELSIIQTYTQKIFGTDFEFVMQEKQKTNDKYKKVCYAKIDGVKYNKKNTAIELVLGIKMVEKIKKYIGGCDLPILFDIADNIGKGARTEIFNNVSSQVFYTRIDDNDVVERKLNIINGD